MDMQSIVTQVVAALIVSAVIGLSRFIWDARKRLVGAATAVVKPMSTLILNAARDIGLMWFFLFQLQILLVKSDQMTRWDVFWIAFWTWWALFYLAAMLGLGIKRNEI
ncbi:hypothetical protein HBO32_30360 [Pseudomonas nitroreducens]|uniref:hypothetical protein n=1 Tax=Pseudomonas nitroreducens TaxID=46680 RepID=UPI0014763BD6|nr:hypothetical protein [Pseudomonas nitroreducens]MDG9858528.1 hypothetical protein [Pseudomonas nitroreducens]NMZ77403.1 hypothetical protein [Pseudomonas nitroreducens]